MQPLHEDFRGELDPSLTKLEVGKGKVTLEDGLIRFALDNVPDKGYSDAQIYNYARLKRKDFPSRPPLRMTVKAYASHSADELKGTAGFGFWNQPFMPNEIGFRLPRAIWFFFGSKPGNMAFAKGVPGYGWKAGTLDMSRLAFLLLAPGAPLGFLMMRNPALYKMLWPSAQWAIGVAEKMIEVDLREPHIYSLDWLKQGSRFYVDDELILETSFSPRGPLGFVAWLDNQYAIVTPQGNLGQGLIPIPGQQWLALEHLSIEPLS